MSKFVHSWIFSLFLVVICIGSPVLYTTHRSKAQDAKPSYLLTKRQIAPVLQAKTPVSVSDEEIVMYWNGQDRTMVDRTPVGADPLPGTFNGVVSNTRTVAGNSQLGAEMRDKERNDAELLRLSPQAQQ